MTLCLATAAHSLLSSDLALFWDINSRHCRALDLVFPWVTQLGNGWIVMPLVLAIVFWRLRARARGPLIVCLVAFGLSGLANNTMKRFIDWRRPADYFAHRKALGIPTGEIHFVGAPLRGRTFPSGHANTAFDAATLLVALLGRRYWPAFLVAALVGWSRIYLAAHFPSDVLVGAALGMSFALATVTASRLLARRRQEHEDSPAP
jgi:membrane-associated phospholipid phosphatase